MQDPGAINTEDDATDKPTEEGSVRFPSGEEPETKPDKEKKE